jgi:hypothetical protein
MFMQQTYLERSDAIIAIKNMKLFHDECVALYNRHDMDFLDNLGRRNIVLSQTQEKYFADALSKKHEGVVNDGRTGRPDIVIQSLDKELECKLTSRHKSGAISFQSDYESLVQKKSLDYLYVIADNSFEKFAVLHFMNLTIEDFRPLSNGSRGKVAMFKHKAMKKCNILMGDVINNNDVHIERLHKKLLESQLTMSERQKAQKSLAYWKKEPSKYSFVLEGLDEN